MEATSATRNIPRYIASWLIWPGIFIVCMLITAHGFTVERPVLFFNLAYFILAVTLFTMERIMPHEPEWNKDDGQTFASIAHTLSSKGTVQLIVTFGTMIGITTYISPMSEEGYGIWPRDWPLWVQVIIAVYASEFGLYWAHRLAHTWIPLWRFHAIHHSVTRLWMINTGRFHFIDSVVSIALGMAILLTLGAPMEVMVWLSAITAFIGMLTHCNVETRFGPISYIFNTPGLHRWHHSRLLSEANNNYGENIILWDMVFGTYYNPDRRPPENIGINEYTPPGFLQQLAWPFQRIWQDIKQSDQSPNSA
jgi:sterol desaturase/sphingolipid hydroxylase (fatty acid hydroxylase superfamily)